MQLGLQLPDGLIEIQPEVIVNEYHSVESAVDEVAHKRLVALVEVGILFESGINDEV